MSTPRRPQGSIRVRVTLVMENDVGRATTWSEVIRINDEGVNTRTQNWLAGEIASQWRHLLKTKP